MKRAFTTVRTTTRVKTRGWSWHITELRFLCQPAGSRCRFTSAGSSETWHVLDERGTPLTGVSIDDLLYYLFRFEDGC